MRQNWEHREEQDRFDHPCCDLSWYHALTIRALKAFKRWRNRSRRWARETDCPIVVRNRKNWRTSSNVRALACCRCETSKPAHGVVPLFDATMILFYYIVEIMAAAVENATTKRLANGTRVGVMPIRCDSLWCTTHCLEGLLEKALCCIHIALRAQH
jgi:hypothetical protein